jgi:hypothetical protein
LEEHGKENVFEERRRKERGKREMKHINSDTLTGLYDLHLEWYS